MDIIVQTHLPATWADPFVPADTAAMLLGQPYHVLLMCGEAYVLARLVPHTPADILTLYTPPAQRRQGQGEALMREVMARACAAGCPSITLEVRASNTAAITLYTKLGFAAVSIRNKYYKNPTENGVIMERTSIG